MVKSLQYQRVLTLALLLVAAFGGLGYRLVDLQVLRHAQLLAKAQEYTERTLQVAPRRGDILDARGNLLATSIFVKTVCADPSLMGDRYAEVARVLAPLLKVSEVSLAERLKPRVLRLNPKGEPVFDQNVPLKSKVKIEEWKSIQESLASQTFGMDVSKLTKKERIFLRDLQHKAIFAEEEQMRIYPNQALAAHVLGYLDNSGRGVDGIERTLDAELDGARGWRQTERDKRGRELVALRQQDVEARDGLNVVLTIDSVLQHIVESELAAAMLKHTPISISGIVVRPRTGEILALATLPNFDPNNLSNDPREVDARRNRIISDIAEPGSTFKIVVVSGALNDRVVRLTDVFDCERGRFIFAGKVLKDHESYGVLSVENIITKSSNIGAAKIGIKLGEAQLYRYMRDFGFGARTGIPLSGEVSGIVHPPKQWTKLSISRIPMGHEVAVTPLQMVMAMSAIANHGWLMQPMLVERLEDADHQTVVSYSPQPVRQVISAAAARQMVTALKTVVSPQGTAAKAALDHYTVAGKTGTAQKNFNGVYSNEKFFSSFIGFFPADEPELCISVVMDEPKHGYYGGQAAAPVFKQIAERAANYLNIRPDNLEETPLSETIAGAVTNFSAKTVAVRSP
ncbi:MAG: penicillin-binding protein 2 [Verrucomicrobia bacterium]|nr:penicillin-binding protein 2 [Verrucomicrobiota bacterium]